MQQHPGGVLPCRLCFEAAVFSFFLLKSNLPAVTANTGTPTKDGGAILCARCGVVAPEYFCKKFRYDPISRVVRPDDSSQRL